MEEKDNLQATSLSDEEMMNKITSSIELKSYKYKVLCELLGEQPIDSKNSHGKASQLKRWGRFFEFERKGHSIIITEIYDAPLPKIENRGGNKPFKYLDDLQYILLDYLKNVRRCSKFMPVSIEPTYLMRILGMINYNYHLGNRYRDELSYYLGMDINVIDYFYTCSYGEFTKIIENALNALQKKGIIKWEKDYRVNYKDRNGHRCAFAILRKDSDDYKYVQDAEKYIMEVMECKNIFQVINSGRMLEFRKKVIEMINDDLVNDELTVDSYLKTYSFQLIKSDEDVEYVKVLESKRQLNVSTTQRIKNKVNDVYENYIEEESNIGREDYKIGNEELMKHMLDVLELDMKMNNALKKYRYLWNKQELILPSKFVIKGVKIKHVTKSERKQIERQKVFEAEKDALGTNEEWEEFWESLS